MKFQQIKSINSPIMINTHKKKMVLPRKAEKLCNGLSRRNDQIFPFNKRFCLLLSSLLSGKYLVLVYQ